jgi:uncharacterized protein (TIGR04255 family)
MTGLAIPDFTRPPVVELVLGAQFSPLTKMTAAHYGLFWRELGADWVDPSDAPPIDDQFELFDRPRLDPPGGVEVRLTPARFPARLLIGHRDQDRLIQVQPTRFHFNWRRRAGFYPSYRRLISEFTAMFDKFARFVEDRRLGSVLVNQWELTYIDEFQQGEYWETPADWGSFLPGFFGTIPAADGLVLEGRAAEWVFEIAPKRGRLHVAANAGRSRDGATAAVLLQMTARGPVGKSGAGSLREGLDWGHEAAVGTFLRVASADAQAKWGRQ